MKNHEKTRFFDKKPKKSVKRPSMKPKSKLVIRIGGPMIFTIIKTQPLKP
jgi:hypothetical protein